MFTVLAGPIPRVKCNYYVYQSTPYDVAKIGEDVDIAKADDVGFGMYI